MWESRPNHSIVIEFQFSPPLFETPPRSFRFFCFLRQLQQLPANKTGTIGSDPSPDPPYPKGYGLRSRNADRAVAPGGGWESPPPPLPLPLPPGGGGNALPSFRLL